MFKRLLVLLFIVVGALSVFAGPYEDAIKTNKKVVVYFYTPTCGACKHFSPTFDKISKKYNNCKFLKIDATTQYGFNLYRQTGAHYVPFVTLIDTSTKKGSYIAGDCVMNSACTEKVIGDFAK